MKWLDVDLAQSIVRLNPGETKNNEGRLVYLDDELKGIFIAQWESRKKGQRLLPWVFLNEERTDRIKQFRRHGIRHVRKPKSARAYFTTVGDQQSGTWCEPGSRKVSL
jgi:integrase